MVGHNFLNESVGLLLKRGLKHNPSKCFILYGLKADITQNLP